MDEGVLAAELGAVGVLFVLSSCGPFPFSKGPSLSLKSLAPFFAFLNSTEVRRPTPAVVGRRGVLGSGRPLAMACPSLCKMRGGDVSCSCALVQLKFSAVLSEKSPSIFRRLQGQLGDWGSPVIGRKVGGSRGVSPCRGEGAGPVGSSVGGEVDLRSSGKQGEKNEIQFHLAFVGDECPFSMSCDVVVSFSHWKMVSLRNGFILTI